MTERELLDHLEHVLEIVPAYQSPDGEQFHTKADAFRLVEAAHAFGLAFYGLEVFRHMPPAIQPCGDLIGDWTMNGTNRQIPWEEFVERSYHLMLEFLNGVPDEPDFICTIVLASEADYRKAQEGA